jgi:hypothetical protein
LECGGRELLCHACVVAAATTESNMFSVVVRPNRQNSTDTVVALATLFLQLMEEDDAAEVFWGMWLHAWFWAAG